MLLSISYARILVNTGSICFFLFCFISLIACTSNQKVKLKKDKKGQLEYYSELYTGQDNLPYFKKPLIKRPSIPNIVYYAVYRKKENQQIIAAFQVVIPPAKKSKNSFDIIRKETKRGTQRGFKFSKNLPPISLYFTDRKEVTGGARCVSIPMAIGTVAGFITGVGSAIRYQITKAFDKRSEVLISTRQYRYDSKNRLEYEALYTYDGKTYRITEIRQHFYKNIVKQPYKTIIQNKISGENTER